jgi:hypothetical protein
MLDYTKVRFLWRGDAGRKLSGSNYTKIYDMGPRAATGDVPFSTNNPTLEQAYFNPALKTAGSTVAELLTSSPAGSGSVVLWVNHDRPAAGSFQILESDTATAAERIQLSVDVDGDVDVRARGGSINVPTLTYQTAGTFKTWFYAIVYDTNVLKVWRGDLNGTITLIVNEVSYTPTVVSDDLFFGTTAAGTGQHSASLLDLFTTSQVLTAAEIEDIYNGVIPIFQQRTGTAWTPQPVTWGTANFKWSR